MQCRCADAKIGHLFGAFLGGMHILVHPSSSELLELATEFQLTSKQGGDHERCEFSRAFAAVLHRPAAGAIGRQPAHRRQLSGYIPSAPEICVQNQPPPGQRPEGGGLDVKLVGLFLKHLEEDRGNSARSRNIV